MMKWLFNFDLGSVQPLLTVRGLVLEALLLYFLLGPVTQESDIVASVLSFSLLGIHIIVLTVTFFKGKSLRRSLKVDVLHDATLIGGREGSVALKLTPFRLPPFFLLRVELVFDEEGAECPISLFSGSSPESRIIR